MIHLECDNDEALVRVLGIPSRDISHHAGKPRVAKALKDSQRAGVVGLVDEDPGSIGPPYLKEFMLVEDLTDLGLRRLKHRTSDKWLIEIRPDLEPWLYATAKKAGIRPSEHHLPEKLSVLHDHPKAHGTKLIALVTALTAKGNARMLKLKAWLRV
jgi:hypothetical protein